MFFPQNYIAETSLKCLYRTSVYSFLTLAMEKREFAGEISTLVGVQIPPRSPRITSDNNYNKNNKKIALLEKTLFHRTQFKRVSCLRLRLFLQGFFNIQSQISIFNIRQKLQKTTSSARLFSATEINPVPPFFKPSQHNTSFSLHVFCFSG